MNTLHGSFSVQIRPGFFLLGHR
uniref:Uncharacterized protein n=1 Tax=Lepeophtheirus salmonis TaxID=72036 RepID=A0A0K2V586_LEPSM